MGAERGPPLPALEFVATRGHSWQPAAARFTGDPAMEGALTLQKHSPWRQLRQYFLTGLFALLPVAVTLYIAYRIFAIFDSVGQLLGVHVPGFGLLVTVILTTLFGLLVSNLLGQQIVKWLEWVFTRVPVLKTVYEAVKQVVTTFTDQRGGGAFQSVVLVPYGGGSGRSFGFVVRTTQDGRTVVFVPLSPPTAGFLIIYPPEEVEQTDFSVEDAMKVLLSGGTLMPTNGVLQPKESGNP